MTATSKTGMWFAVCIAASFAAASVAIVEWRYLIFRNDVDLGIFTQVVASVGSGFSSTAEGGVNHLLVHWSPLIVLGWPFVRIFGPVGLEIFQALLISLTLVPIWGLARARFAPLPAAGITAVCALYPILCANAVDDFHEMAFVPFLSATLVYALDRRRYALGVAAAILLACTKEDQFVVLAVNGVIIMLFAKGDAFERRFGQMALLVAGAGAAVYFAIVRNVIGPHLAYSSLHFYNWREAPPSPLGALVAARVHYVLHVLAPLAFLPLISRYGLFLIVGFVEALASHEPVTVAPGAHYSALLSGYALAAFVDGLGRLATARLRVAAAALAAVVSIAIAIYASPMEYWYYLYRAPNAHDALLQRTIDALPPGAEVGTEDEIFSHLGLDRNASIQLAGKQWILFDRTHYSDQWHNVDEPVVRRLLAQKQYTVVTDRDGIVLLQRLGR
ncbi:MAG TPA: DUF2079 domain-containing protein [Candidatus Baltobacteraceae bacterium]|jgi:uncharacterized membrane protein